MAAEDEISDNFEDVTPNPRILAMLGRIPFEPWQCLAELIDNSIDALLSAQEVNLIGLKMIRWR